MAVSGPVDGPVDGLGNFQWWSTGSRRVSPGAVDGGLPTVGQGAKTVIQETTRESTPSQRRWNAGPGPRRPTGDDRLMDKVQATSDVAPEGTCPTCGRTSDLAVKRLETPGVAVADYKCPAGHIWITKWMVAA